MRTSNAKARAFVEQREDFQGNHLYGEKIGKGYVVFSYGRHWPLFIFNGQQWFENAGHYSQTTSKHKGQTSPSETTTKLSADAMRDLAINLEVLS